MAVAQKKKLFDGRYEILSIVGRGSRSVVYHARNVSDGDTEVALKVLVENKKDKVSLSEKLRREALALVSSHHPSVIRLDDFHSVGDICYLAMEYAGESDLRKFAEKNGGLLDAGTIHDMLLQMSDALDYIHRTGIIHRDIKPDNLLVVSSNQFRVGDFGVAFLPGDPPTTDELRNAVGTMDYMAPEVLEGVEYTQRSDIYSLGVSAYELLSGKNPFAFASMAEQLDIRRSLTPLSELNPQVPAYLSAIIQKACAYDPKERFQSAKEIIQQLKSKKTDSPAVGDAKPAVTGVAAQPKLTVVPGNSGLAPTKNTQADTAESTTESKKAAQTPDKSITNSNPSEATSVEPAMSGERSEDMEGSIALKDSRQSRTPTVFISKESVEKVRSLNDALPASSKKSLISDSRNGGLPTHSFVDEISRLTNGISNGTLLIGSFAILFAVFLGLKFIRGHHQDAAVAGADSASAAYSTDLADASGSGKLVPSYKGEALTFPQLPTGVYTGAITGVIGTSPVPLTVLSFANRGKIAIIVGADGFNPAVVDVANASEKFKVVANGYIIEFTGKAQEGLVEGTVKNLVTGTNGAFKIRPSST